MLIPSLPKALRAFALVAFVALSGAASARERISLNDNWRFTKGADRPQIAADGKDLGFITVTVTDKDGLVVPRAANRISFAVTGPGEIIATDNGDPTSFESFQAPARKAFNGKCLVIVRGQKGRVGRVEVTATAEGLASGRATFAVAGR